jgi:hypothetical protein
MTVLSLAPSLRPPHSSPASWVLLGASTSSSLCTATPLPSTSGWVTYTHTQQSSFISKTKEETWSLFS